MPRPFKIRQVWRCSFCGAEYHSPIRITEVFCPTDHKKGRSWDRWPMQLVDQEQ